MPDVDTVNHLLPLTLPCQIRLYAGDQMFEVVSCPDSKIIRANRAKLRDWLGTGLDVQWGISVSEIQEQEGKVKLVMADGREVVGDVLVGADGVNSQGERCKLSVVRCNEQRLISVIVRRHLLPAANAKLLNTLPIASVIGEPLIEGEDLQKQLDLGASAWATVGPNYHLFAGLKSISEDGRAGRYYWFVNWHDDQAAAQGSSFWSQSASKQDLLDFALKKTEGLEPHFTRIIKATKVEDIRIPPIVFKDMELDGTGLPSGRITLLGDAAHPMVPCKYLSATTVG